MHVFIIHLDRKTKINVFYLGSDYDNKPGAWRESSDRGRPTFKDRGGFRDEDRDRDWPRYDRDSRDRDGGDRGSSFGPRRNYGDSDWDRDGQRRQGKPPTENKRRYYL